MSDDSSWIEAARRLLEEGASAAAVLESFHARGLTERLPMIQAFRQVVPVGLQEAAEIVGAYENGDPRVARLDRARLSLLAHPGVSSAREGEGPVIYRFFRDAVMDGHDALTIIPAGQNEYGNSFRFWWRPEPGGSEHDPLSGSISGSQATIASLGEALRRTVSLDPVLARHTEIIHVSAERVTCRFHVEAL